MAETPSLDRLIAALDPEVRAALADVDRTLINLTLEMSPWERLRSASEMAQTLARYRREAPPDRDQPGSAAR
ncbi:MAG: hypothetical protein IT373_36455 [Polyangiaceae bacterium]|nr:hypothetical protein [Polyangiaceae bacterium]